LVLALLFGFLAGTTLHIYVLLDILPLTGRWLPVLTGAAMLVSATGFYILLGLLRSHTPGYAWKRSALMLGISIFTASGLFYGATAAWPDAHRYPTFLLPENRLELRIIADQPRAGEIVSIEWMTTALGEVSFSAVQHQGWERVDDRLVLTDIEENHLAWAGKTGNQIQLVLSVAQPCAVKWVFNGVEYSAVFADENSANQIIQIPVKVSFYATRLAGQWAAVLVLSALLFTLLVLGKAYGDRYDAHMKSALSRSGAFIFQVGSRYAFWEGWAVILVILLALALRSVNLNNLTPYTDEYIHMLAAKEILNGDLILSVYRRGLFVVTLPVVASFKLFGLQFWAARLPGVMVNSLAIIPLYLITRRINRPVAFIASLLFATSPWIIAVARNVREYAYYPFYFYWIILAMLAVLQRLPTAIVLDRRFLRQIQPGWFVPAMSLVLPILYGLFVDRLSTSRIVFIAYCVFALFVFARVDWRQRANWIPLGILIMILTGGAIAFLNYTSFVSLAPTLSIKPLLLFFPNPPQQWYFHRLAIISALALLIGFAASIRHRRLNSVPLFFMVLFCANLVFFTFFFSRGFRPRYAFSTEFWYIPVYAFSIYAMFSWLKSLLSKKAVLAAVLSVLALVSLNFQQTLLPLQYRENGFMPITDEVHYQMSQVDQFIQANMAPGDALISTIYGNYVNLYDYPNFQAIGNFSDYGQTNPKLIQFMQDHPQGWFVLDNLRYEKTGNPFPLEPITVAGVDLQYISEIDGQHVWRWQAADR
jgi:hypothetical protein